MYYLPHLESITMNPSRKVVFFIEPSLTRTPYLLSWVTLGGFFSICTTRTLKHRALLAQVKVHFIQGLAQLILGLDNSLL